MSKALTRQQIRRILARNRGSMAELARDLDVSPVSIHNWLRGRITSERIAIAAEERARLLLEEESELCLKTA